MGTERQPSSMAEQHAETQWPIVSRVPARTRVNGEEACNRRVTALRWEIEIRVIATVVLPEDAVMATEVPAATGAATVVVQVTRAAIVRVVVQATRAGIARVAERQEAETAWAIVAFPAVRVAVPAPLVEADPVEAAHEPAVHVVLPAWEGAPVVVAAHAVVVEVGAGKSRTRRSYEKQAVRSHCMRHDANHFGRLLPMCCRRSFAIAVGSEHDCVFAANAKGV